VLLQDRPEPFRTDLARFVYYRTYSRWRDEWGRRENWAETVDRATEFLFDKAGAALTDEDRYSITAAIHDHEALPSMRLLWSAGEAAKVSEIATYNCAYAAIDDLRAFDEALFILMNGTGFGFSVESEYVEQLPRILKPKRNQQKVPYEISDSREGWAQALRFGLETWFQGGDVEFDYSALRPQGARLKTMGGRSSGPDPLRRLLEFTRSKVQSRAGRRLSPINCHDILCTIGEVVVAGGVRRSSLISLSDLDNYDMRMAKYGAFYNTAPYRSMANNSVAYNEKPDAVEFMEEFLNLAKSGSGERGIFNRESVLSTAPRRKRHSDMGLNPCSEILLRSKQFCNLTSVVAREEDTLDSLSDKVRIATILGTVQSTFTNFPYIRSDWKKNCDEERLLGVSINGQMDCPVVRDPAVLVTLRETAISVNREYAQRLGINPSAAITTGKPAGTESQIVTSGSGAHTWWDRYYIRRIRISVTDPLFQLAKNYGVPCEPEVGQDPSTASTWVLSFPVKAPASAITRHERDAIQQLEHWLMMKTRWCEHSQSVTIYVKNHEYPAVQGWVYDHWDLVSGLSFLPSEDHVYRLAPYESITEAKYNELVAAFPQEIDYTLLSTLELEDQTTGARDFACTSGACEL
jgi:ribonucleoside-triphosphate reductase